MPLVQGVVKGPGGEVIAGSQVLIDLVTSTAPDAPGVGYVGASDLEILGRHAATPDAVTGTWSATLAANSTIVPDDTVYRVIYLVPGKRQAACYIIVPDGAGPYWIGDILADPPTAIEPAALSSHIATFNTHVSTFNAHVADASIHSKSNETPWFHEVTRAHAWRQTIDPANSRFNVVVLGDSNTDEDSFWGYTTWVQRLRAELQREFGNGGYGYVGLWRNEWSSTGDWTRTNDQSIIDLGPYGWCFNATGGDDTYTLTLSAAMGSPDNIDFFYVDEDFLAVDYSYSIDGGAYSALGLDYGGAAGLKKKNISASPTTSIAIKSPALFVGYAAGVALYEGSVGCVVHNLGSGGESIKSANNDGAGDRLAILDLIEPQLTIVALGLNDTLTENQTDLGDFETWYEEILDRALTHGDVLVVCPQQQDPTGVYAHPANQGDVTQAAYEAVIKAVAAEKRVPVLSLTDAWGTFAEVQTLGYSSDDYHINQAGHDQVAALVSRALRLA